MFLMHAIKQYIFGLLLIACTVANAQTANRLLPVITANATDVCPDEEVQILVQYTEPENRSILLNGIDEYANIPADPAFNFGASTNFTIEFYIKTSSVVSTPQSIVNKAGTLTGAGFNVSLVNGLIVFSLSDGTGVATINGLTNVADGAWHHVAIVAVRAGVATIYVDGLFDNDGPISGVGNIDNTELVNLGAAVLNGAPTSHFTGAIDEVRIWNTALALGQITSNIFTHINPGSVTNLVGYWDMNELAVPQIIDCSTTGATGTLSGAASLSADAPALTFVFKPVWSDGQTGQSIFVYPDDTTTFKVEIGYCKYYSTDSITINVLECDDSDGANLPSAVWVPNTFTPNGDFKNDVFQVQANNITYYEIMIFNRAGNILYHSKNILSAWDGTFEGNRVKDDVYTYVITYRDFENEEHKKYGTVNVLH